MHSAMSKADILDDAGCRYWIDRMAYVHRPKKKLFSIQWIEEHSEECLSEKIAEPNDTGEWQFYFNEKPSPYVRNLLVDELDGRRAAS